MSDDVFDEYLRWPRGVNALKTHRKVNKQAANSQQEVFPGDMKE